MGAMIVVMLLMLAIILVFMFVPGITFQVIEASFNKIKSVVAPTDSTSPYNSSNPNNNSFTGGKRKKRK